jgi:hypothetical protein
MWIRIQEMKHVTFDEADQERARLHKRHREARVTEAQKVRIKRRSNGTFDVIAWHKSEGP